MWWIGRTVRSRRDQRLILLNCHSPQDWIAGGSRICFNHWIRRLDWDGWLKHGDSETDMRAGYGAVADG